MRLIKSHTNKKQFIGIVSYIVIIISTIGLLLPFGLFMTIESNKTIPDTTLTIEQVTITFFEGSPSRFSITLEFTNPSKYFSIEINRVMIREVFFNDRQLGSFFTFTRYSIINIDLDSSVTFFISQVLCSLSVCPEFAEIYSLFPSESSLDDLWTFIIDIRFDITYYKNIRRMLLFTHEGVQISHN